MIEIDDFKQVSCQSIGIGADADKTVVFSRELHILRGDTWYAVSVATPGYIGYIEKLNASLPEEGRRFNNYLPIEDLFDQKTVCEQLSGLPKEVILPFLEEVIPSE